MESLEKAPVAVIMVNWRSAEDTIECLESLMHSQQPMRLIVCDNQSGDGSVEKILAWARGERPVEPKSDTLAHLTRPPVPRSEEHTSELQSLMRISYAVFCLKKKKQENKTAN